jgi:hypothetical protein
MGCPPVKLLLNIDKTVIDDKFIQEGGSGPVRTQEIVSTLIAHSKQKIVTTEDSYKDHKDINTCF